MFAPKRQVKTYGKQNRKVEPWFSPDLRKRAFSFSNTSSDRSVSEPAVPKKRKKKNTAATQYVTSRLAKHKAMAAMKELESEEENVFIPDKRTRKKITTKPVRKRKHLTVHNKRFSVTLRTNVHPVLSSSEKENDSVVIKDKILVRQSGSVKHKHTDEMGNPSVGRFVTHRKRAVFVQSDSDLKQTCGVSNRTLNSSEDFVQDVPLVSGNITRRKQPTTLEVFYLQSKHSGTVINGSYSKPGTVSCEHSNGNLLLSDSKEQRVTFEHPLLCSTPSIASKQKMHCPEPIVSEISFSSCEELDNPPLKNDSVTNNMIISVEQDVVLQKSHQYSKKLEETESVLAQTNLELLKKRCHLVSGAVVLEETDILKEKVQEPCSMCLDAELSTSDANKQKCPSDYELRDSKSHYLASSSTSSSSNRSAPSLLSCSEFSDSAQPLIDRLKSECLSSCLTVSLQPLNLKVLQGKLEFQDVQSTSPLQPQTSSDNCDLESEVQLGNTAMELSTISPPMVVATNRTQTMEMLNERNSTCSSRKVGVSGMSISRWTKRGESEWKRKQRESKPGKRTKVGECSLNCLKPAGAEAHAGSSATWQQGISLSELTMTPLRFEQLNLSGILANFTPDTFTTHKWGRLKAALSLHKKKTAFSTPQRLAMSNLKSPGGIDTSFDLFGTSLVSCTPLYKLASSHPFQRTTTEITANSFEEDISDAEKVYQECQQDGPISFDDCIPPKRMKRCTKIGEGTFGEVFSTINSSNEIVALKIIPVEGHHKVNGEAQKTFGEILHEIIISKELSSLEFKEKNKTKSFIRLNNLHLVRGYYPSDLLKAWDKFHQQKGSENDRPDFFSKDQLFLILEFEFGGSDLENMNGKISSMAQAKSILHQVTAALAVAEEELSFEHRDLHWGNILVKSTKEKYNEFILNGLVYSIETRGVHVNIIDYSLSRLEIDGLIVSCDISNDEELFMGQGDYQFEIYRLMKKKNNNCWGEYNPHSNVLWLHYLADKLLNMRYKTKVQNGQQKSLKTSIKSFHSEMLKYRSAADVLMHCSLFQ